MKTLQIEENRGLLRLWIAAIERAVDDWNHADPCLQASARAFLRRNEIVGIVLGVYGISRDRVLRRTEAGQVKQRSQRVT